MEVIKNEEKKVNVYTCDKKHNTVIKHREAGTTPMFITCITCGNRGISNMYKVPQDLEPDLIAFKPQSDVEWDLYKKEIAEFYKKNDFYSRKNVSEAMKATREHVKLGGVVMIAVDKLTIK